MKKLVIHFGAHKTGTTSIQKNLEAKQQQLEAGSVCLIKHADVKKDVVPLFKEPDIAEAIVRGKDYFGTRFQDSDVIVMSCEDMFGKYDRFQEGRPYFLMDQAISRIRSFVDEEVEIVYMLATRNYAEWIESAYSQGIKNGAFYGFKQFYKNINFDAFNWFKMISSILEDFSSKEKIIVWFYEDFKVDNDTVYQRFIEEMQCGIEFNVDLVSNPSYSMEAEIIAKAANRVLSKEDKLKLRTFLMQNFSTYQGYTKVNHLDTEEARLWNNKYLLDKKKILSLVAENSKVELLYKDKQLDLGVSQ